MKSNTLTIAFFLMILVSSICVADTPITTPTTSHFCSSSGRYCATSTAASLITVVADTGTGKKGWSVREFVPYGYLSDDGRVIASCYPGKNLVPDTVDLKFTVIKLFSSTGKSKHIVLGDLYSSMDELPTTVSHKEWGRCLGFHDESFEVERANGSIWKIKEKL